MFAELTKNKKGAEYVALFTYFSFQGEQFIAIILTDTDCNSLDPHHFLSRASSSGQRVHAPCPPDLETHPDW